MANGRRCRSAAGVGAQPQPAGQHIVLPPVTDFLALLFLASSCFLRLKSDWVSRCGGGVRLSPDHFQPRPSSGACRCLKKERKCPVCVYEPVSLCECVSVHVVLSLCGCLLKRMVPPLKIIQSFRLLRTLLAVCKYQCVCVVKSCSCF